MSSIATAVRRSVAILENSASKGANETRAEDKPERANVPGGRGAHEARGLQAGEGHTPLSIGLRSGPRQAAPQPQSLALRRPTGQRPMRLAQRGGAAPEEAPRAGHGGPTTAQSTGAGPPRASGPAGRARRRPPLTPSPRAARPPLQARRRGPPLLARRRAGRQPWRRPLRSRAALWPPCRPSRTFRCTPPQPPSPEGFLPVVLPTVLPDLKPFRGVHPARGRKGWRQAGKRWRRPATRTGAGAGRADAQPAVKSVTSTSTSTSV